MNPMNYSFTGFNQFQYYDQQPMYEELTYTGIELPEAQPYLPSIPNIPILSNNSNTSKSNDEEKKPKKEIKMEEEKPEKKKRGRKMQYFGREQQKDRKRINRRMSNRNDYGHQGYFIYLLLSCGCQIVFDKVTDVNERVEFRKLKIGSIKTQTGDLIFNRSDIEKYVRSKLEGESIKNITRAFRNYMNIEVDNRIIDILVKLYAFTFQWKVKKEPDHLYMPKRITIIQHVFQGGSIDEKDMINQGCMFYDQIKTFYGGKDNICITLNEMFQRLNSVEYQNQIIYSPHNTSPSPK